MTDVLVRGVDETAVLRLRKRAKRNHRSLEAELKLILEQESAEATPGEVQAIAKRCRRRFVGRKLTPIVELLREDRER